MVLDKMKNLLIHLHPEKGFVDDGWGNEPETLVRIQIDNSLKWWKREDILLVTNFPYEYNGVKALVVGDENYCWPSRTATKINVFVDLIDKGLINELTWFHDTDAFQLEEITEEELGLEGLDMGVTEYGLTTINDKHNKRMSTGTVFFRKEARDLFIETLHLVYKHEANEEVCMLVLRKENRLNYNDRVKTLGLNYNFATRKRQIKKNYDMTEKPIKVLHFHPSDIRSIDSGFNNLEVLMYGKGSIGKPLMTDDLIKIFHKYNIK